MEFLNTTVYTDKKTRNGSYAGTLAASVKDDPTTTNRQLKTEKSKPF